MASRTLTVSIVGDASSLSRAFKKAGADTDKEMGRVQSSVKKHSLGISKSLVGAAAGFASVGAAIHELKASVATVEGLAKGTAMLTRTTGIDNKEASEWVTLARVRGVESKQLNMGFVALARNIKAASTGTKASVAAFKELGISQAEIKRGDASEIIRDVSDAFAKMPDGANKAALAQKLFARQAGTLLPLLNKGSGELNKQLGVVDKYGAALDKHGVKQAQKAVDAQRELGIAWQGAQIQLATKVIPFITKGAEKLGEFVKQMRDGTGAGGRFAKRLDSIADAVRPVVKFFRDHPKLIAAAVAAWGLYKAAVIATVVAAKAQAFRKMFTGGGPMARAAGVTTGAAYSTSFATAGAAGVRTASGKGGKLRGAFSTAGRGLGGAMGLAAAAMFGVELAKGVESTLKDKLPGGDRSKPNRPTGSPGAGWNLFDYIKSKVGDGAGKVVDTMTSGIGAGGVLPTGGAFGGSLHGARPSMRPFAVLGSRYGLQVTSGRDDHSKMTSSGNVSWHSSGEAIDMAGPAAGMHAYAAALRSKYGSRLAELISPWAGLDLKNGQPFTYDAATHAQHSGGNAHVHVAFDSGRPGVGDGIGQAVTAARAAGFRGEDLVEAVAIAGAESRYRANAQNLTPPDHSIGFWQINQLAHHGRFGSDAALKNPTTNAKAAFALFKESGFHPWSTYPTAAKGYLARARKAVAGGGRKSGGVGGGGLDDAIANVIGGTPPIGGGVPARSGGSGGTDYGTGGYEQGIANVGVEKATATAHDNLGALIRALQHEKSLKTRRLKKINRTLKRRIKKATRTALTDEKAQLIADRAEINGLLKEYKADAAGGATTITGADALTAGVADSTGGDAEAGPTELDFIDADAARAGLTDDPADDLAAARKRQDYWQRKYNEALTTADPRDDTEAAGQLAGAIAAVKELEGTINNEAETRQRLIDATESLALEVKTQNEFSRSVAGIATREAVRALADVISGQIVGTNLQGRKLTAGNGVIAITP